MQLIRLLPILGLSLLLLACVTPPPDPTELPTPLDVAIKNMSNHLLSSVIKHQGTSWFGKPSIVAVNDFLYQDSGDIPKESDRIQSNVFKIGQTEPFQKLVLKRFADTSTEEASYLLEGLISFQPLDPNSAKKYYFLKSKITDIKTGQEIAQYRMPVSEELDISSKLPKGDGGVPISVPTTDPTEKSPVPTIDTLKAKELLAKADDAYHKMDYRAAKHSYQEAIKYPQQDPSQTVRAYGYLYKTLLKLGEKTEAETAFAGMVKEAVRQNNLSVRFVFGIDSPKFLEKDTGLVINTKEEYEIWLRQIGNYFNSSSSCLHIIGHTSATGPEDYNLQLSKSRATTVQTELGKYFPDVGRRSKISGMGFKDCINCQPKDDESTEVDRRVEFKLVECSEIS